MSNGIARFLGSSLAKRCRRAGRLRRGTVILGVLGLAASAGMLTAGSALAAGVGAQPGDLQLIQNGAVLGPAGGPLTTTTTWQTTTACPAGFQASAQLTEWTTGGSPTFLTAIASVVFTGLANATGFSGSLDGTPGELLNIAGINATTPGTTEWVIGCYAGGAGTGAVQYEESAFISVASGATSFTISATAPPVTATTTTLTASPNPVAVNGTVTLTAAVAGTGGSGGASPAGTVQFEANGTNIGSPVAVNTGGVSAPATTTTTFAASGNEVLTAVFVPTDTVNVAGSTSNSVSEAVGSLLAGGTNPVPVSVSVPLTGSLSVTVATSPSSVTLTPASPATTPDETATGTLNNVTVTDTRNSTPGWSVSGLESPFTEAGGGTATIPASSLGWTPAFVGSAVDGATIGAAVPPTGANAGSTGPGLGTAATLGLAPAGCGFGANVMNAALLLDIPSATPPGAYAGTLTITYIESQPPGTAGCVPIGVTF